MTVTGTTENVLRPASVAEYEAFLAKKEPSPAQINENTYVVSIPLPLEQQHLVSSTFCYIFTADDGSVHILDPGWDTDENYETLINALEGWGFDRVDTIVATHMHPDHLGLAERLRKKYGSKLVLSRTEWDSVQRDTFHSDDPYESLDRWGMPKEEQPELGPLHNMFDGWGEPDILVDDGDTIHLGRDLKIMLTPGHSQGSISVIDDTYKLVFPGDHIMPHRNPGLGTGYLDDANPIGDFLEASERLLAYDGYTVCTAHGYRFEELGLRIEQHMNHHLRRTKQAAQMLETNPGASVWEVAKQLHWSGGWERLEGYYILLALSQTAMHMEFVRDTARSARWLTSTSE